MASKVRNTVLVAESLTMPEHVAIGRTDDKGKLHTSHLYTRDELQAIVQQAFERFDILADPFAADLDALDAAHNGGVRA